MEALSDLRSANVPVCLISNTGFIPGETMRKVLAKIGILPLINDAVFSNEVQFAKPDVRIFQNALKKESINDCSVIHIGDSVITDHQGAQNAGIDYRILNVTKRQLPPTIQTINTLADVKGLIS